MVLMTLTLNCGIRPVEIKKLRFRDITRTGSVCKVRISELIAKTRKEREAVCWNGEEVSTAIQLIKEELHKHFNVEITEDHFIFPSYKNINKPADRFVQNLVKRHLRNLNLWTNEQPDRDTGEMLFTPKTLYSARATYITKLVRERVDIYVIAQNAGTSIAMIEKYYSKAKTTDFVDQLVASERPEAQRTEGGNTNAIKPRSK
jgi:integrase